MSEASPPPTLQRFGLAPQGRARAELFGLWREMVADVFELRATASEIAAFDGDFSATIGRRFVLSRSACAPLRLARSHESLARGRRDQFAIRLVEAGAAGGFAGAAALEAKAGDVVFFDLAQTLAMTLAVSDGLCRDTTLWAPRSRVLSLVSDEAALHGLTLKGESPPGALVAAALRALAAQAGAMSPSEFDALADGVLGLAAKAAAPVLDEIGVALAPLASYVTIRRYIDRNFASPALGVDSVAKVFGLSRASLYRLFEPAGGVASYIRKARLNRAYQEIATSEFANRRISAIAYRLGFKNMSAFGRLFRSVYGLSPGEARERSMTGFVGARLDARTRARASLAAWLDGIE